VPNQLKYDPTRTTMLRRHFEIEMRRRFRQLSKLVVELVDTLDIFGIKDKKEDRISSIFNIGKGEWRFETDPQKVELFKRWLEQNISLGILEVSPKYKNKPWLSPYIESAFIKGMMRTYTDVKKKDPSKSLDWYKGTQDEFLRSSFWAPETTEKLQMMFTRSFDQLKGVTDAISHQLSIILTDGLVNGRSPREIARVMSQTIDSITRKRALVIARTEVIRAHAEGQLLSFERLGVDEVGVEAEWMTAGDDKVCELCAALEGMVIPVEDAHGLLPRHPNCRCAWVPAVRDNKEEGQLWDKKGKRAIKASISVEGGKKKSVWSGKSLV